MAGLRVGGPVTTAAGLIDDPKSIQGWTLIRTVFNPVAIFSDFESIALKPAVFILLPWQVSFLYLPRF